MQPNGRSETERTPLDQAARAGWMYYVGGMTQDQIATELGVSRQRAQRLVSRAMAEGLIHVRVDHPIAECMELERALIQRFDLQLARVAPSAGGGVDPAHAIAPLAASVVEKVMDCAEKQTIAVGTGRALRAMADEMRTMDGKHHKLVSLIGNISPDGTASNYDVIMRIADKVGAPYYPMPLPVFVESEHARDLFYGLKQVQVVEQLAAHADVTFVGVGQMDVTAPMMVDGFVDPEARNELEAAGAVGEIASWVYDENGAYIDSLHNRRIGGLRAGANPDGMVIGVAGGRAKYPAIKAALKGRLINGLVTDEHTARFILQ